MSIIYNEENPERVSTVGERLISTENFDSKYAQGNFFGCATVSFSRLEVNKNDIILLPPYNSREIIMDLSDHAYRRTFHRNPSDDDDNWIPRNRVYANGQVIMETAHEMRIKTDDGSFLREKVVDLGRIVHAVKHSSNKDDETILSTANSILMTNSYNTALSLMGGPSGLVEFITKCLDRGGVQLIFNYNLPPKFTYTGREEDNRAMIVKVPRIPNNMISHIIPLGNYEINKFSEIT